MRSDQVVELLDRIEPLATTVWLGGGWGVDALAGRETRPHGDLDLCVDGPSLASVLEMLGGSASPRGRTGCPFASRSSIPTAGGSTCTR